MFVLYSPNNILKVNFIVETNLATELRTLAEKVTTRKLCDLFDSAYLEDLKMQHNGTRVVWLKI